jgi:hypothetical protein
MILGVAHGVLPHGTTVPEPPPLDSRRVVSPLVHSTSGFFVPS